MSRIHPDHQVNRCTDSSTVLKNVGDHRESPSSSPSHDHHVLTVWKRSSMSFQGTDGFTVFDRAGRLAYRVDNYTRKDRFVGKGGGLVLMDGSGTPLLTLKPQMLSMQYQWNGYRGDQGCGTSQKSREFAMRRPRRSAFMTHSSSSHKESEAEVFMGSSSSKHDRTPPDFKVEGSFSRRNCKITSLNGAVVAKIARKRVSNKTILLSDDVFSLVVHPGFDPDLAMAFVIVLDRIAPKPFAPIMCS